MVELTLIVSGLFLGVLARTALPFIRKMKQGKIKKFEYKFLIQGAGAAIIATIIVFIIYPYYEIDLPELLDFQTAFNIFTTSFAFGFASNTLVNEILEWKNDVPV
ncbi:MAG: hypothetical protein ACLFN5_05415 [bacterium]